MLRRPAITLLAGLGLAVPPAAQAQQGVFVDPDSPSGKEYAIPLESARRQADPSSANTRKVAPGTRDQSPLFGEGIEDDSGAGGSSGSSGGQGDGGGRPSGAGGRPRAQSAQAPPTVRAAATRPGAPDGGIGTALTVIGGAVLVLLLGGGAGLALRRSGRRVTA